jgi:YebC/PmpR family DNA-binding regulatory protein
MVDCLTDNRNRTVADVRHAFTKFGGNLGADGSVAYLFNETGLLSYPSESDEERIMEAAIEAGAADIVSNDDGSVEVLSEPEEFDAVKEAMAAAGLEPEQAEVTMRASTTTALEAEQAETMLKLLDTLDELDDVQQVYSNADIPEELFAESG